MLDIQIVSDIHAEFWPQKKKFGFIKPSAPILALLGDICCCGSDDDFEIFKRFILECLPIYNHIIFVTGNHEYYFNPEKRSTLATSINTMQGIDKKIQSFFKETAPEKLHFLNNSSMVFTSKKGESYMVVGSTLWSWIPEEQRTNIQNSMNDYQHIYVEEGEKIRKVTSSDIAAIHLKNYKYIKTQILKAKKAKHKVIILTHHKPYLSDTYNPNGLDPAYESDLTSLMDYPVLWGYGHTHIADSSVRGKTWLFSNPKGYPKQKTKFNKSVIVRI